MASDGSTSRYKGYYNNLYPKLIASDISHGHFFFRVSHKLLDYYNGLFT